jgi:hypothetical protein
MHFELIATANALDNGMHAASCCTMHLRPYVCNSQSSSKMTTREAASSQVHLGRLPLERRLTTRKPKRLPRAALLTPCPRVSIASAVYVGGGPGAVVFSRAWAV